MRYSPIDRALAATLSISLALTPVAASAQTPLGCAAGVAGCVLPLTDPGAVRSVDALPQKVAPVSHGIDPWVWILGALALGGIIVAIATSNNDNNNTPVSPG